MPLKQPKKAEQKKDSKSEFDLMIQSTINSNYPILIPVKDESVILIKDPISKMLKKFKVDSQEFIEYLGGLIGHGLLVKLDKDFDWVQQFSNSYKSKWDEYKKQLVTTDGDK